MSILALWMRWFGSQPWTKTVLPGMLLMFGGLLCLGGAWHERWAALQQADAAAARLAAAAAQDLSHTLEQLELTLETVVLRHGAAELRDMSVQDRNAQVFDRAQREPYFAFINLIDAGGIAVAGIPRSDSNWSGRDYFRALRERPGIYIGRPFRIQDEQRVAFPLGRRMADTNGSFAGVTVMGVRLGWFRDVLANLGLEPTAAAILLRDDGMIMLRHPFDLNDIGNTIDHSAPFYVALRGGVPATVADPTDRLERRFTFHRVGSLPLILGIGS